MQSELGNGLSQATHDPTEGSLFETIGRVEHDVNDLIGAMALLGIKRCFQCHQFFRSSDPGALFDAGQPVCFACIPEWYASLATQVSTADRERIEAKLASWLRKNHGADVVREISGKPIDAANAAFELAVKCGECAGSGKLLEGPAPHFGECAALSARGNPWAIVSPTGADLRTVSVPSPPKIQGAGERRRVSVIAGQRP